MQDSGVILASVAGCSTKRTLNSVRSAAAVIGAVSAIGM
jgi:hypothetical protein